MTIFLEIEMAGIFFCGTELGLDPLAIIPVASSRMDHDSYLTEAYTCQ
jgi:hypothetical protein